MGIVIREMALQDYDEVLALWQTSEGVGLSDADLEEGVARFLDRNPGLSFVALDGEHLVGAVLCGHDGRRGYIHHLVVSKPHCNWVNFSVRTASPDADSMVAMVFWLLTDVFAALAGWQFQRHEKKSQR
ncbi:MAG: GNAT family N-acetyltransferase [Candidatus Binatia bacterium]